MKTLTAQEILKKHDVEVVPVECPEWGGQVFVKCMSGRERGEFESSHDEGLIPKSKFREVLAQKTVCDKNGELLFTEDQIDELAKKSCAPLERIFRAALKLNKLTESDVEALKKSS